MINREEVLRIANLSKLKFDEDELVEIEGKLNGLLEYVEKINEVNVEGIEPLYSVLEFMDSKTREDIVENTVKKEDFLNNAPNKDEEFVILPKIV